MLTAPTLSIRSQQGFSLIEGLVSILIFSVGILGLIALQATAVNQGTEAKYRTEAAFLVNQLLGQLAVANPSDIGSFAHRPSGATVCSPSGSDSTYTAVTGWLTEVEAALPNATASKQQVKVDASDKSVSVTICWQMPQGAVRHHTVSTQLQWQ